MKRLRERIGRERADLWKENSWILHHDNASSHKAIIVNEFLAKNLFLFLKLKLPLRGTHFQSIEDIKENLRRELKSVPEIALEKCFDDWIIRWHEWIILGGAYFEGDKINLVK